MKIAYTVYPDFTALDPIGPHEVISRWPNAEAHLLAAATDPVQTDCGLTVVPTDTPQTLPDPDLIIVPASGNPLPVVTRANCSGEPIARAVDITRTTGHIPGTDRRGTPCCLLGGRRTHAASGRDSADTTRSAS